jgi:hypothetical protein
VADQFDLAPYLAQLEAERAQLDIVIADVRRRLGLGQADTENGAPSPMSVGRDSTVTGRVRSDEFFRLSIADAITKYLGIMKQPQNPMAIVNGLKSGGVLTNAKNFYANVNTELKRMKARNLVVNTPSGWGLAEWYPSKPKQSEPINPKKKAKKKKVAPPSKALTVFRAKKPTPPALKPGESYREFLSARRKAGKSLQEIGAEWAARKEANR